MRKMVKSGAAALMLTCMASHVVAATAGAAGCARPEDMTALKAAAIQQKLMVAAFSCDAVQLYNNFVRAYQKELQVSDRALQNFFRRMAGAKGDEQFHAYKTHLANASSMQSIGNMPAYCADAKTTFDASGAEKSNLTNFVMTQEAKVDEAYRPCEIRTAGASAPPKNVPLPRMKPAGDEVIPAQGTALAPN
jgi:hypothetical protein